MSNELKGRNVAILSAIGVERVELERPKDSLKDAGANVTVISLDGSPIRMFDFPEWSGETAADAALEDVTPAEFDALYIPGGIVNPDILRANLDAVAFVRSFFDAGKPVASMCHGPSVLVTAGVVNGRRVASWPSIKADLVAAGAIWTDEPVVVDGQLATARNPGDIPKLNERLKTHFAA